MKIITSIILLILTFKAFSQVFEGYGLLTDPRDGQQYITVEIGDQTWMAENLNYRTFSGSYYYMKDQANALIYGRLYSWPVARDACPAGWHLPTEEDWQALEHSLGMDPEEAGKIGWRGNNAGSKLKSTSGWQDGGNGHNETGFTGLPGGYGDGQGGYGGLGVFAYFWTATELENGKEAWTRKLYYPTDAIGRSNYNKKFCFSVRCVKNQSSPSND